MIFFFNQSGKAAEIINDYKENNLAFDSYVVPKFQGSEVMDNKDGSYQSIRSNSQLEIQPEQIQPNIFHEEPAPESQRETHLDILV